MNYFNPQPKHTQARAYCAVTRACAMAWAGVTGEGSGMTNAVNAIKRLHATQPGAQRQDRSREMRS